jgi:hypothetical protein
MLCIACCSTGFAQHLPVRAVASLDTNQIRIGERVHLKFDVVAPKGTRVFFPVLPDTMHNLEVVERSPVDSSATEDAGSMNYRQRVTITCFDAGIYFLEPFRFYYREADAGNFDSTLTEGLVLKVQTVQVDTTKAIRDIKPPMTAPFTWEEAIPYVIAGIIILLAMLLLLWWLKKRRKGATIGPRVPLRPAHETALEKLRKLQEKKLWQQGFYKEYQSEVSDTIREYIEGRFSVPALELTSDETLNRMKRTGLSNDAYSVLEYIFRLADMVKFAKSVPLGTENEQSMQNAVQFVMITKPATRDDVEDAVKKEGKR